MKKINLLLLLTVAVFFYGCPGDDDDEPADPVYKQRMREFVQLLGEYAKAKDNNFIIIPQNGQELVTENGEEDGSPATRYLQAIDGAGREDLFYGYDDDDQATPAGEQDYMVAFLDICKSNGVQVLTTDYCWSESKVDDAYQKNHAKGYISFSAPDRELRDIPTYPANPYHVNSNNITKLAEAKNFLYLLNPEYYPGKQEFIAALAATNYDVLIVDYFFEEEEFTSQEIAGLKNKLNGGKRLVISYMSIGEAEDYRYYWDESWDSNPPDWLKGENPEWEGNYKVAYWEAGWQAIIFGSNNAYLDKIIAKGFDGAYLDIIDAFEYFE